MKACIRLCLICAFVSLHWTFAVSVYMKAHRHFSFFILEEKHILWELVLLREVKSSLTRLVQVDHLLLLT